MLAGFPPDKLSCERDRWGAAVTIQARVRMTLSIGTTKYTKLCCEPQGRTSKEKTTEVGLKKACRCCRLLPIKWESLPDFYSFFRSHVHSFSGCGFARFFLRLWRNQTDLPSLFGCLKNNSVPARLLPYHEAFRAGTPG